ncbi:hypothetical protein AU467_23560 [Mesorhizobium loti]|uniref:Uncharacterized protein n=1 Tax=Rhizobium loti TaxID=381 RepID=A0A101KS35_RHILI|nr:hypothetical protein AU467_23560 [Mesorhizobium loti]
MDSEISFKGANGERAGIHAIEKLIMGGAQAEAAKSLKSFLLRDAPDGSSGLSLGDAIQHAADREISTSLDALVLLRCLAQGNIIPATNSTNQIARNVVALCERSVGDLCQSLGVQGKKQTFEKYSLLLSAHEKICSMLSPLTSATADIDSLIASRQNLLSALSNGLVKLYCGPFDIAEVRTRVDAILKKISRLSADATSFGSDLHECREAIQNNFRYCEENVTFLTGFFRQYLEAVSDAVEKVVRAVRARVTTSIAARLLNPPVLQKRYPLHDEGREIALAIPLRSSGPGLASSVTVTIAPNSSSVFFQTQQISLGNVSPGDFTAVFEALVVEPCQNFELLVSVTWEEAGQPDSKEVQFQLLVNAQKSDIDWSKLEYKRPYSTDVAKGAAFVGRAEKVQSLANRMLRTPMESFYVTGQKRVGKTSLALAAAEFARSRAPDPGIEFTYLLWGKFAHEDPRAAMRELGERISDFIVETLPPETPIPSLNFDGSIAPLTRLAELAERRRPGLKYVIIIDEFDEIHPELYQHGNLAETFFANIRALTTCDNICVFLVGGENMPYIMNRQGQKLNKLVPVSLNYFSRDSEWEDFKLLIRKPTEEHIFWHDEAVSEVFNLTNGNPFFQILYALASFTTRSGSETLT